MVRRDRRTLRHRPRGPRRDPRGPARRARPVRRTDRGDVLAGARTFVEAGPGGALTGLVGAILGDRPHTTVGCDGLHGLLDSLVLAAAGVPVDPLPLFAGRDARPVDAPAPAPSWFVNGHLVTTADGDTPPNGLRPAARVERPRGSDAAVLEYLRAGRELIAAQREVLLRHLAEAPAAPVPAPRPILPGETLPDGPSDARTAVRAALAARTGHPEALLADELDLADDLAIDPGERTALLHDLAARAASPNPTNRPVPGRRRGRRLARRAAEPRARPDRARGNVRAVRRRPRRPPAPRPNPSSRAGTRRPGRRGPARPAPEFASGPGCRARGGPGRRRGGGRRRRA
ncbi:hypothetical protein [Actinomadura sp. CNU-125]|uniref:hypothetical protein n=1 Tax=Actinomadura sp. CNU-125 TaxID=1904961 RepID=UPI0009F9C425|nr:hypothetical protein [Actinomadura sp. CNU-125]